MKKFFSSIFVVLIFITTTNVFSQTGGTSVYFPLTNTAGKDAIIKHSDPGTPFGTFPELVMSAWVVNGQLEIIRSLLEFDDLSTIPTNALVGGAQLILMGVNSSLITYQAGNSYPSTIYPTNEVYVERIKSPWAQNAVTWGNQPAADPSNPAIVPFSNSQWGWDYTVSSSVFNAMVQDMVTNPSSNFGFMLKLQNENAYRHMIFGSSDNSVEKCKPHLAVRYYVPEFTYCYKASDVYTYTFTPEDITGCNHEWLVDGVLVSNSAIFNYNFPSGATYQICHRITIDNIVYRSKCATICVY